MEVQRVTAGGVDLATRARAAAEVAAAHAAAVDADARFPNEAFAEIRRQKLLGIQVPASLGGEGASLDDLADVCYILGQACGSAGLIYAMHQIKIACIVRHAKGAKALEGILRRVAAEHDGDKLDGELAEQAGLQALADD